MQHKDGCGCLKVKDGTIELVKRWNFSNAVAAGTGPELYAKRSVAMGQHVAGDCSDCLAIEPRGYLKLNLPFPGSRPEAFDLDFVPGSWVAVVENCTSWNNDAYLYGCITVIRVNLDFTVS